MLEKLSINSRPINQAKLYTWNINSTKYFKKFLKKLHARGNTKKLKKNRK